jgi:hypothetical protein
MDAARVVSPLATPPATDPLRRLWAPVTIRVAWELVRSGLRPKGSLLREAREHALFRVPPDANSSEAELIATAAAREFVDRLNGIYKPWKLDPDLHLLPDPRWRQQITALAGPVHDLVFRLHYADGLGLDELERSSRLDRSTLRAGREAVRALARQVLTEAGVLGSDWDMPRFDRFIARVATAAGDRCPGPWGLSTEAGRSHAESCPRCSRALRMMKEGILSSSDLTPPDENCLPTEPVDLVALMIAPQARKHIKILERTLTPHVRRGGEDLFLVDGGAVEDLQDRLCALAENGTPPSSMMRVVRRLLPGRWGRYAILGPGPEYLRSEIQTMEWGDSEGIERLPEPLPPPPSSASWWMVTLGIGLVAGLMGLWIFRPEAMGELPLKVEKTSEGLVFQTSLEASVDVWGIQGANLLPLFHSESAADKGILSTGDGRYRLPTIADAYVVIASPKPLAKDTPIAGAIVQGGSDGGVERRLEEALPGSAVVVAR